MTDVIDNHPVFTGRAAEILDSAERQMREGGYNAVSFRDIAADIGIRSASLHYHFPSKRDLGVALVRRYTAQFYAALSDQLNTVSDPSEQVAIFIDLHRQALRNRGSVCLCAILGAEARGLPPEIAQEVGAFYAKGIDFLRGAYRDAGLSRPASRAKAGMATLEGAMIVAQVLQDARVFEAAVEMIAIDED